jgi:hypothetical protein
MLILGVAFYLRQQGQVQAHLRLASAQVSNTTNVFRQALGPDFVISQKQIINTGCKEESPELSFTRIYDCNAIAKVEISSVQAISAT